MKYTKMREYKIDDDLVTYDPDFVDEHSDTSDFEDHCSLKHNKTYNRGRIFVRKLKAEKEFSKTRLRKPQDKYAEDRNKSFCYGPNTNTSTSYCHHCGDVIMNFTEKRNFTNLSQASTPQMTSKTDLLRKKLSSIFFRSKRKQMSIISENDNNSLNNRKVYCDACHRRQMRKLQRKRQGYSRPVYLVEDVPAGPLGPRKDVPDRYCKLNRNQCSHTSSLSSNSETEINLRKLYKHGQENELDKEIKKEYLKYRKRMEKLFKNRPQQYSKHDKYQVVASQCCQNNGVSAHTDSASACCSTSLPFTASGFWEFFFNKLNAKYQEAKSLTSSVGCYPGNCGNTANQPQKGWERQHNTESQTLPDNRLDSSSQRFKFNSGIVMNTPDTSQFSPPLSSMKSSSPLNVGSGSGPNRPSQGQFKKRSVSPKATQASFDNNKFCQEPHENLTKALSERYNGEILCIHNPPCVLINGCLNLPKETAKSQNLNIWPVVTETPEKKTGYLANRKLKKAKKKLSEQACQHHPPFGELQHYQPPKLEKVIQSVCNHNPPCKVVPGCAKPLYDPQLLNSCVHVPMCKKVPECMLETEIHRTNFTCDHMPRCYDVPECRRNYLELMRGEISTQVRPRLEAICRHQPPCLMIPRCLARVMSGSFLPGDAIPDCTHKPPCDLIPACCRKFAKDTVSAIRPPLNRGVFVKMPFNSKTSKRRSKS